jgi:DNA primase
MAGTVEEIKAKADIVSIISERISVKKAGKHFKALCPFHGEKTPSFMISPELQIYKCFGCGESGDVISFLEKYEGMDFNEAITYLSERTGIKLETGSFQPKKDKEKIIEINELATKYYQYLLLKHKLGKDALFYLTEKRKLKLETIEKFKIGYSPDNPQLFETFFIRKKGLKNKDLVTAGICYEKYGRPIDRFSGRIIFPLFDHRGNTVGFSGRILSPKNTESAKYINTPETPAYHKSEVLFGLNFTKGDIKNSGYAIVTEGELDTISPWQRGIKNIIAIKGSALTEAHTRLLSRFTKNITLALDADFAGNAAAKRGIEIAQNMGLKVKVARLKGYKDPDEMAVSDIDAFSKCVKSAVPVYDFIIDSALEKYDRNSIEGKMDISKEAIPFLAKIEDDILKAYYVEYLAKKIDIPYESVYSEVEKNMIGRLTKSENGQVEPEKHDKRELLEETLLTLYLMSSPKNALDSNKIFKTQFIIKVLEKLSLFLKKNEFEVKSFSQFLPEELRVKFNEIYLLHASDIENLDSSKIEKEIEYLKKSLGLFDLTQSQKVLIEDIKTSEEGGDKEKVKTLQKKLNDLVKVKTKLEGGNS